MRQNAKLLCDEVDLDQVCSQIIRQNLKDILELHHLSNGDYKLHEKL
jgi:hypothetical protein